jgi:NADPH2:quinone reductase
VLVHAAAGGVGGFAIQLAKAGKAFVIGACSAPNTQYVRELGADEIINYRTEDVFQRAKAIAGDRGIDAIVDTIGPGNGVDNLGLLGPEGGLACIAGIPDLSVVPNLPYSISIHDIGLGGVLASPAFRRRQEDLGRMATELMALDVKLIRRKLSSKKASHRSHSQREFVFFPLLNFMSMRGSVSTRP